MSTEFGGPEAPFQVMPALTAEEYAELKADIETNGIRTPIDIAEDGAILDGHHRQTIAIELGITDVPRRVLKGLTDAQKFEHAYAVNLQRRQLSRAQRRALIEKSLKANPRLSDRQHAKRTGASDKTVAARRRKLEATAEIPQLDTREGADRKTRGPRKPTKARATKATAEPPLKPADPKPEPPVPPVVAEPVTQAETPAKPPQDHEPVRPVDTRELQALENVIRTLEGLIDKVRARGIDDEAARHALAYADKLSDLMNVLRAGAGGGVQ